MLKDISVGLVDNDQRSRDGLSQEWTSSRSDSQASWRVFDAFSPFTFFIKWVIVLAYDRKAMAYYLQAGMSEVHDEA